MPKRSKRTNVHPKLQVEDPRAVCDTQDWQVQTYPDAKNMVDLRAEDVKPAATEKKTEKKSTDVEVTPDLRPIHPSPALLAQEEDWELLDELSTPRRVPTETQWVAVGEPVKTYLEAASKGDASGLFIPPTSPKDREVGMGRKTVTFQLEDPDETAEKLAEELNEKQQRWEDVLKRRKGQQKEKGQRAEKIARDAKKEKGSSSSNHRKA
jgi:hypothetical protein